MFARVLACLLLATWITPPASMRSASPPVLPDQPAQVFLPSIQISPTVAFVETARGEDLLAYPSYFWVYGYVHSLSSIPVYSVTVGIDATYFPYEDPEPYHTIERVHPAFPVTLPGQPNPFSFDRILGKASASFGPAHIASALPALSGESPFRPLTIVHWEQLGKLVSGVARNDSGQFLRSARVVILDPQNCSWRDAVLDVSVLEPGQETGFQLAYPCSSQDLLVVGQGIVSP